MKYDLKSSPMKDLMYQGILCQKLHISKLLTSILHLTMVDRNTALWRKQERLFCCYFYMFQTIPIFQLHGHIHINKTTSASMCHAMIYLVISSLSFTSTHTHTYAHINIILQPLSQKYLDSASQIQKTGCKATVISSILCLTMFISSRDKRIKTPLLYCQRAN